MSEELLDSKIFNDKSIRPNAERAKIAQYLIWTVMAIDILSIGSAYMQLNLLKAVQNNQVITEEMASSNDLRALIVGILYAVVFIISAVTFIQWFRRAYYNLNRRVKTNHTEGWAAGFWFIPILSLFRPYQIMREMWDRTTGLINSRTNGPLENKSAALLGIWWTLWILSNFVGNYVSRTAFKAESIPNLINSTIADIVLSLLGIPLAIAAVMMIKSYAAKEERLLQIEKDEMIGE